MIQRRNIIVERLANEPADVQSDILRALKELDANPTSSTILPIHRARVQREGMAGVQYIAELPHDYFLSYSVHDNVPMANELVLQVVTFVKVLALRTDDC